MTRPITRILVPTDFGAASDVALDYATLLAQRFAASLQLLHVVDDPFVGPAIGSEVYIASVPSMRATLIDEAAARLSRLAPRARRHGVLTVTEVRIGRPHDVIRDVAAETEAGLIVMGTHGRTGMAHLLLGSVAERLVRTAPCPVLTVRGDAGALAEDAAMFERELVPTE